MLLLFELKVVYPVRGNFVSPTGPLKCQKRPYTRLLSKAPSILLYKEMPKEDYKIMVCFKHLLLKSNYLNNKTCNQIIVPVNL